MTPRVRAGEDDEQPNYVDLDPIRPYKRGEKTAPLPTYFICGKEVCASPYTLAQGRDSACVGFVRVRPCASWWLPQRTS